ncbi:putative trans-acting enoyl reductase [Lachnellula suecica]|uniref:Putative trans-acting enoyl reductase n=1 Tax=Lachnellula suecica TaxID=602035 RepID=A0A8T9C8Z5_9HELO|nr:putative trans-acting enoyl reductase [Lachnellula suecica]
MSAPRAYDLVVFGATGYTGKLTAEYIATKLPTDLKWAIAGRSRSKLEAVAAECKTLNPDRIQPEIEVATLDHAELNALTKKTTLLIATIGPYCLHGEHAVKACAENGTHYLDVTGEVMWVSDMIKKYERTAKSTGAIMIPQIGVDSAPADLVTWTLCSLIREKYSAPTAEVILSLHEMKGKPSGGTLSTILSILDVYTFKELREAGTPFALSPIPGPATRDPESWTTKLLGIRAVSGLGIMTTSLQAVADRPIVQRSWGLLGGPSFYGPNFRFSAYMRAQNHLIAVVIHFGLAIASLLIAIPPVRTLLKRFVTQPGDGPTKEQARNDRVEYKGIGNPDVRSPAGRAFCRAHYEGSLYHLTGMLLAKSALSILKDGHKLTGGIYTPACLGQKFIDRLDEGGFKFEKKTYEN